MRISDWSSDVCSSDLPLARWRLWRRGYNQAGLIARALARDSAAALMLDGLVRRRATASSGGLGRKQRFPNVRGDRKSVGEGKSVSVRVDLGGRLPLKKKNYKTTGLNIVEQNN